MKEWPNNWMHTNRRQAFQFGCSEFFGRWICGQRPVPAAVGEPERYAPSASMSPLQYLRTVIVSLTLSLCVAGNSATVLASGTSPVGLLTELSLDDTVLSGGPILVNLSLEDGEKLLFEVDTGSGRTLLDESLTPKLGRRVGSRRANFSGDNRIKTEEIFLAPKLYAGNTRLLTGSRISTVPMLSRSTPAYKGILGMDCLQHYCIQVDCVAGKLRFLDPDHLETENLGQSFPITFELEGITAFDADCFGLGKLRLILDTGCKGPFDGILSEKLFDSLVRAHPTVGPDLVMTIPDGRAASGNAFSSLELCGQTYTDLKFSRVDLRPKRLKGLLGMRFLARHLATFNFPKRTVYLKRISNAPLTKESRTMQNKSDAPNDGPATPVDNSEGAREGRHSVISSFGKMTAHEPKDCCNYQCVSWSVAQCGNAGGLLA
jgi:hypothetical protein